MKSEDVVVGGFYWIEFGLCDTYVAEAVSVCSGVAVVEIISDDHMNGFVTHTTCLALLGPVRQQDVEKVRCQTRKWWQFWKRK